MELVTLVNRSSKVLRGVWDGKHYNIDPGQHAFPILLAQKFKDQNPVMGSLDVRTGDQQFLIGIIELGDDVSPLEPSDALERYNRNTMTASKVEVIKGDNGIQSARDVHAALGSEHGFVKP